MKKIIGLLRTSTNAQDTASQKADLLPYIESKGFKKDEIEWMDYKGASAHKQDEKYLQMIEDIKTKIQSSNIKNIAMWHLNRLGRNKIPLITMLEFFKQNSIQVYIKESDLTLFKDGKIDKGTEILWTLFSSMIETDTIELLNKTKRGKEYAKNKGKVINPILGYCKNSEGYAVIDKESSKIVRDIFELYANENYSFNTLYNELKDRGYKISKSEMQQILKDERYLGQTLENGNIVYPRLIDDEIWNKVIEKRKSNNNNIDKISNKFNYGSKLIICENCLKHYSPHKDRYSDIAYNDIRYKCTNKTSIRKKAMDYILMDASFSYYKDKIYNGEKRNEEKTQKRISLNNDKISNIERNIYSVNESINRLNSLYINGKLNESKYNEQYNKLTSEIESYKTRINLLKDDNKRIKYENKLNRISIDDFLNFEKSFFENTNIENNYKVIHEFVKVAYIRKLTLNNKEVTAINIMMIDGRILNYFYFPRLQTNNKIFRYFDYNKKMRQIIISTREYKETSIEITDELINEIRTSSLPKNIYTRDLENWFIENEFNYTDDNTDDEYYWNQTQK